MWDQTGVALPSRIRDVLQRPGTFRTENGRRKNYQRNTIKPAKKEAGRGWAKAERCAGLFQIRTFTRFVEIILLQNRRRFHLYVEEQYIPSPWHEKDLFRVGTARNA